MEFRKKLEKYGGKDNNIFFGQQSKIILKFRTHGCFERHGNVKVWLFHIAWRHRGGVRRRQTVRDDSMRFYVKKRKVSHKKSSNISVKVRSESRCVVRGRVRI